MSFDALDDAVLTEILQRLPDAKFTNRLKLVCTNWNRVLSTPCFVQSFIDYHETCSKELKPLELIFLYLDKNMLSGQDPVLETIWDRKDPIFNTSKLDVTFPPSRVKPEEPITSFRVVASCKELLLCESFVGGGIMYYICNPLTRSWVALPPCPTKYDDYYNFLAGLVCCDRYYRVVRFIRSGFKDKALTVLIFCFETNQWKESSLLHPKNKSFQSSFSKVNSFALAWNGVLHWLTEDSKTVVAYKPHSPEELHFIDVPEEVPEELHFIDEPSMVSNLGVCKLGSLQLFQLWVLPRTYRYYDDHTLRVWELEDYGTREWRLKHKVYTREMVTNDRSLMYSLPENRIQDVRLMGLDPNDEDVVFLQYEYSSSEEWLFSWNLVTKEIGKLRKIPKQSRSPTNLFQLVLPPWWPTAVPTLSAHNNT